MSTDLNVIGRDALNLMLQASTPLTFQQGDIASVTLSHPSSGGSVQIGSGALTRKGSFKDPATGLRFRYNQRSGRMSFRMRRADVKNLLQYFQQSGAQVGSAATSIQNGYADVVVTVGGFSGAAPNGMIRFVWNTNTKKGRGTKPKSFNDGG